MPPPKPPPSPPPRLLLALPPPKRGALSDASSAGKTPPSAGPSSIVGMGESSRLISSFTSDASALAAPGRHSGSADADDALDPIFDDDDEDDDIDGAIPPPLDIPIPPAAASARLAAWYTSVSPCGRQAGSLASSNGLGPF